MPVTTPTPTTPPTTVPGPVPQPDPEPVEEVPPAAVYHHSATGNGLATQRDWLATSEREVRLTEEIVYAYDVAQDTYFFINRYPTKAYFQLVYTIRPTMFDIAGRAKDHANMGVSNQQRVRIGGLEWWEFTFVGVIGPQDATSVPWFMVELILYPHDTKTQLYWQLRSSLTEIVPRRPLPTPSFYDEVATTDPWDGVKVPKRDDVPIDTTGSGSVAGTQQYSATPAPGRYYLKAYSPYNRTYGLYHQLVNDYSTPYGSAGGVWPWTVQAPLEGSGYRTMFQRSPNGDGWLDLPAGAPSWDAGGPHMLDFEAYAGGYYLKSVEGKYLAIDRQSFSGNYGGGASYDARYTDVREDAILWQFDPAGDE